MAIAEYFGEQDAQPCGICDNCVRKEKEKLSPAEFESIYQKLRTGTQKQSLTPALYSISLQIFTPNTCAK